MKIHFLGVGEACDEELANTSLLLHKECFPERYFLLDCGFTATQRFFACLNAPDALDGVWISHFHGDHFLGVPQLLLRLWEMGRQKELYCVGQNGIQDILESSLDLAYPGLRNKLGYKIHFISIEEKQELNLLDFKFAAALSNHSVPNLALRLEHGPKAIYYSGDGAPGDYCANLARNCDLLVQEGFSVQNPVKGHMSVYQSLEFARRAGAKNLAIVHVQRRERRKELTRKRLEGFNVFLPRDGERFDI